MREVAAAALPRVDLTRHWAAHPRLGAVDHVSVHPLGYVDDSAVAVVLGSQQHQNQHQHQPSRAAALCARLVGAALAAHPCGLPVYYYGGASSVGAEEAAAAVKVERNRRRRRTRDGPQQQRDDDDDDDGTEAAAFSSALSPSSTSPSTPNNNTNNNNWQPRAALADLRRRMGYFSPTVRSSSAAAGPTPTTPTPTTQNQTLWQGVPPGLSPPPPLQPQHQHQKPSHTTPLDPKPDEPLSPVVADPRAGVCLVGSTDAWVVNLNAPLVAAGPDDVAAARRVARRVSERGGGMKGVQAMALEKRPVLVDGVADDDKASKPTTTAAADAPLFTGDYAPAERGTVVVSDAAAAALAGGGAGGGEPTTTTTTTTIIEVACNLVSPEAEAEAVAREIERLAKEEGLAPAGAAYRIGAAPEELVERWRKGQAASG